MDTTSQRLTIAEACGWVPVRAHWEKDGESAYCNDSHCHKQLPYYLNDLNAMHEAGKMLTIQQATKFAEVLGELVLDNGSWDFNKNKYMAFICIHATAAQRAEAFLKTLDKWTA